MLNLSSLIVDRHKKGELCHGACTSNDNLCIDWVHSSPRFLCCPTTLYIIARAVRRL